MGVACLYLQKKSEEKGKQEVRTFLWSKHPTNCEGRRAKGGMHLRSTERMAKESGYGEAGMQVSLFQVSFFL